MPSGVFIIPEVFVFKLICLHIFEHEYNHVNIIEGSKKLYLFTDFENRETSRVAHDSFSVEGRVGAIGKEVKISFAISYLIMYIREAMLLSVDN